MITWIASYPKSGNTWVKLFLAHYHGWTDLNRRGPFGASDISRWAFDRVSATPGKYDAYNSYALKPAALMQLIQLMELFSDRVWLKTHSANAKAYDIPQIPVELTKEVIYIVRDPRDVVLSYAYHMNKDIDSAINDLNNENNLLITNGAPQQYISNWSGHVKSWLKFDNIILLKYEDLLEAGFKPLLEKLNIEYDEEKYQATMEATSFSQLKKRESENGFKDSVHGKSFFRVGKAGQWQDQLTTEQLKRIINANSEMMQQMGYST